MGTLEGSITPTGAGKELVPQAQRLHHGHHPHGGGEGAAVPDHGGAVITPTGAGAGIIQGHHRAHRWHHPHGRREGAVVPDHGGAVITLTGAGMGQGEVYRGATQRRGRGDGRPTAPPPARAEG